MHHTYEQEAQLTHLVNCPFGKAFELHYQPIFEANNSQEIVACEALLRTHYELGKGVTIEKVISVAEQNMAIIKLGYEIIRAAFKHAFELRERGRAVAHAINLSIKQLRHEGFVDEIEEILKEYPVPPKTICFELTETEFMGMDIRGMETLARLRDLGFKIAIDDFGKGYSSLTRLRDTRIDVLKIDRSFVEKLVDDERTQMVVESIITLSHRLQLTIVAEGIETPEQLELLKQLDCHEFQGFLLAKPMNEKAFDAFLEDNGT